MILDLVSVMQPRVIQRQTTYSCSMVLAKPQAIEKMVNSVTAHRISSFVPNMSLSLA
jgi:hypothetical protein